MSNIKVSVIVPVYNGENYIKQSMDSLIGQSLKDIEIICVDDGSTDKTAEVLKQYEGIGNVRIIHQENAGAGAARNNGLKAARGEYLSFLDADDFFEKDMLEMAYGKAKADSADIIVFNSDQYFEDTNEYREVSWTLRYNKIPPYTPFKHRQMTDNVFKVFVGWAWDKLFLREFVEKNNLKFQEIRTSNDMYFVFSSVVLAQRITVLPKQNVLVHQRRNNESSLSNTREKSWHCFYEALGALKDLLVSRGIYDELKQDYINYALHACLWNLNSLAEPVKTKLTVKLREEWFDSLDISGKPEEYFYNKKEYEQYREINGQEEEYE